MRTVGVSLATRSLRYRCVAFTSIALLAGVTMIATVSSAGANSLGPTNAQRLALAHAKALQLLGLATLPSGSARITTWTAADGMKLAGPDALSGQSDLVDKTEFFLAPSGSSALAWINAHVPKGASVTSTGSEGGAGSSDESEITYGFKSTSVLPSPELEYSMLRAPHTHLEIRIDALVAYTPRKSTLSVVPAGAIKVKVTVTRGLNTSVNRSTSAVATNKVTIDGFLSEVNALPAGLTGTFHCPMDNGSSVTLAFYDANASHAYAVVVADDGGCGTVTITQWNSAGRRIGSTIVSGGAAFAQKVAKTMGITNPTGTQP